MIDRLETDDTLKEARAEIRSIMDELSEVNRYTEESNIDELSGVLADQEPDGSIDLDVATIETKPPETGHGIWEDTDGGDGEDGEDWFDDNDDADDSNEGGGGGDNSSDDGSNGGGGDRNRKVESIPNVAGVRIVPVGLEEETGRIYRHFIADGTASIRMAVARMDGNMSTMIPRLSEERRIRPNDPLYLTENSNVPCKGYEHLPDPMFEEFKRLRFPYRINNTTEEVEVIYSIARAEILGEFKGQLPGTRAYGQHAHRNRGISIVREDREITLEDFFVREGGGGAIPQNRWWGCEVRFTRAADDLFGVDHNKQQVSTFSETMKFLGIIYLCTKME